MSNVTKEFLEELLKLENNGHVFLSFDEQKAVCNHEGVYRLFGKDGKSVYMVSNRTLFFNKVRSLLNELEPNKPERCISASVFISLRLDASDTRDTSEILDELVDSIMGLKHVNSVIYTLDKTRDEVI